MNESSNIICAGPSHAPPRLGATRGVNYFALAAVFAALVGGALLFLFNPSEYAIFPACAFHSITGLHCPGCGATRAMHQLLHGHVLAALRLNALFVVSLPVVAGVALRQVWFRARGHIVAFPMSITWLWVFLGVAMLFGVARNLPGFEWLAP